MTSKGKIKVIKKGEVKDTQTATAAVEIKSKKAAAREMVSTVTNWVSDFQRNKREETKIAFEQLFAARSRTNEV